MSAIEEKAQKKRKIEFYGDSITAGYAVEDTTGKDSPDSTYTNNYLSYASITARHFDAEYSFIIKSGIGVTISWFPIIMPEIYDLTDPQDPQSKWDFSKEYAVAEQRNWSPKSKVVASIQKNTFE